MPTWTPQGKEFFNINTFKHSFEDFKKKQEDLDGELKTLLDTANSCVSRGWYVDDGSLLSAKSNYAVMVAQRDAIIADLRKFVEKGD